MYALSLPLTMKEQFEADRDDRLMPTAIVAGMPVVIRLWAPRGEQCALEYGGIVEEGGLLPHFEARVVRICDDRVMNIPLIFWGDGCLLSARISARSERVEYVGVNGAAVHLPAVSPRAPVPFGYVLSEAYVPQGCKIQSRELKRQGDPSAN